jgi:hypothetical protein
MPGPTNIVRRPSRSIARLPLPARRGAKQREHEIKEEGTAERLPKLCFPSRSFTGRHRATYIDRYRTYTADILTLSLKPLG